MLKKNKEMKMQRLPSSYLWGYPETSLESRLSSLYEEKNIPQSDDDVRKEDEYELKRVPPLTDDDIQYVQQISADAASENNPDPGKNMVNY